MCLNIVTALAKLQTGCAPRFAGICPANMLTQAAEWGSIHPRILALQPMPVTTAIESPPAPWPQATEVEADSSTGRQGLDEKTH